MKRRPLLIAGAAVVLAAIAVVVALFAFRDDSKPKVALPSPHRPILPDLSVAQLSDVTAETGEDGTRKILFTTTIVNVGRGPFMVHATRRSGSSSWLVTQRFRESPSGLSELATPANLVWGGHGHNHWHVKLGAAYELYRLNGAAPARAPAVSLTKAGYCFFDQRPFRLTVPGAPGKQVVERTACSGRSVTSLTMGLSPGWGDPYSWLLSDQWVDVTELPAGTYRLTATADPDGWFRETDERNNTTFVDLRMWKAGGGSLRIKILRYGPSAGKLKPLN